jgi:Uma2 family endonuclease
MSYTIDVKALTDTKCDRTLEQLCRENPELKFETDARGKLIIMSPTGSLTGERNSDLNYQLQAWNRQNKLGWLINPDTKQVEIYRIDRDKQIINNPSSLSGEELLPELTVDLSDIF